MFEVDEVIAEFLVESHENLDQLDRDLVALEREPGNRDLVASIFRTIHTIKGTCGFLSFGNLENVTHIAENILSQLRNGERSLTPELTSLVLETMDVIRKELASIEATSVESGETYEDLRARLTRTCNEIRPETKQAAPEPPAQEGVTSKPADSSPASAMSTPPPATEVMRVEPEPARSTPPASADDAHPEAAAAAANENEKQAGSKGSIADSTIRVDVGLLDKLMNLVGELVLARNQILQFSSVQEDGTLSATAQRLNLITTQLQEGDRKSTRLNSSHIPLSRMPSSA